MMTVVWSYGTNLKSRVEQQKRKGSTKFVSYGNLLPYYPILNMDRAIV
jgi:hypothetical protein